MKNLNSYEITKKIGRKSKNISQKYAKEVLKLFFEVLEEEFEKGAERVCFRNKITFYLKELPERFYRNPQNGEKVFKKKRKVLAVSLGKDLKSIKKEG